MRRFAIKIKGIFAFVVKRLKKVCQLNKKILLIYLFNFFPFNKFASPDLSSLKESFFHQYFLNQDICFNEDLLVFLTSASN